METEIEIPKYPPVFFVRITDSIRRRLVKISRRFTHPNITMLEYLQNLWLLGAISVATELGIADILKDGSKTISELASLTGSLEDPLYRIMRLLASEGIFREMNDMRFSNTRVSESLQEKELRFFIQHSLNSMQFRIFGELMHSVKTGRRTSELFIDKGVFEHMGQSKELNDLYNKAMTNTSKMQVAAVLSSFNFNSFSHIVDVGGGLGFFISAILSKYKTIHGTLFDLPQVVNNRVDGNNFAGRLKIIAGSFFETIPEGGDLYLLKNILHGWSDDDCITILKNIRKVLSEKGRLMIIEVVVESMNKPSWGKMTDIFMMAGLGGRERTRKEYQYILEKAGYKIDQFRPTVSPASLIIASLDGNN
jgi:hypothetical protein